MTIETKYNINQTVWFMHENKPTERIVREIHIETIVKGTVYPKITYEVYIEGSPSINFPQSQLYITKEELLKSL